MTAAAMFMPALGYGVATNSEVYEWSSFINLSALSGVSAQGEREEVDVKVTTVVGMATRSNAMNLVLVRNVYVMFANSSRK